MSYHTAILSTVVHMGIIIDAVYCDCEIGAKYLTKKIWRMILVDNILARRRVSGIGNHFFAEEGRENSSPPCAAPVAKSRAERQIVFSMAVYSYSRKEVT